jgi:hypothetical protein
MADTFTGVLDSTKLELGPANVYLSSVLSDSLSPPGTGDATMEHLGYMGDDMQIAVSAEAIPLTGAQAGTTPLSKVISGGTFKVTLPFKEITLANFARAFPNALRFTTGGDKVEFRIRTGLNMRTNARKMIIKKVIGGIESTLTSDIFVIPFVAPVEAEVIIPFSPTEQRVIAATFEAWPDGNNNNRWAFVGDSAAS